MPSFIIASLKVKKNKNKKRPCQAVFFYAKFPNILQIFDITTKKEYIVKIKYIY